MKDRGRYLRATVNGTCARPRRICLLATLWVAAGCASVPDYDYYTLDMRSSGAVQAPYPIDLARIDPGEALSRPEILIRKEPTQIEYYATQRWASGLGEMIAEKLKSEFGEHFDAPYVIHLRGDLLAFEQVDTPGGADAHAKLELQVEVRGRGRSVIVSDFRKTYEHSVTARSAGAPEVVVALSEVVETIAERIAEDIDRLELPENE